MLLAARGQKCPFGWEYEENIRLENKTHQFQTHLKNSIFGIEGSSMDQTKEIYLTHVNLLLTHFLPK